MGAWVNDVARFLGAVGQPWAHARVERQRGVIRWEEDDEREEREEEEEDEEEEQSWI